MKWLKKNGVNILLIIIFLAGIGLLTYPSAANYWNSIHQSRAITRYSEVVDTMDSDTYRELLEDAIAYNERLFNGNGSWTLTQEQMEEYNNTLLIEGSGAMGYIEIDKINCFLPIYHGTEESVLQVAVGHIAGSSLPVGGESSHTVLSGHRGLPSAKLFTDLDKMEMGDTFVIRVLNEVMTYEVDQILIVNPSEVDALVIEEGQDLCTLVTCTPYGVNSHRLLVRGHRVENAKEAISVRITPNAEQIEPILVAVAIETPVLILLILLVIITTSKRKKK